MNWLDKLFEVVGKATQYRWFLGEPDEGRINLRADDGNNSILFSEGFNPSAGDWDSSALIKEDWEHIARFDPPTVKLMLEVLAEAEVLDRALRVTTNEHWSASLHEAIKKLKAHVGVEMIKEESQRQRLKELENMAKPIMGWLHRHYNPHATVTIQTGRAELSLGELGATVEYEEVKRFSKLLAQGQGNLDNVGSSDE